MRPPLLSTFSLSLTGISPLMKNLLLCSLLTVVLSGCGTFNKFDVRQTKVSAPDGKLSVAVAGVDERPNLRDKRIADSYVGLSRIFLGVPFNIKTATKQPFALEVAEVVTTDLGKNRKVAPAITTRDVPSALKKLTDSGMERLVVIRFKEWESQTLFRTSVWKNVILEVYNKQGKLLASAQDEAEVPLHGNLFVPPLHARQVVLKEIGTTITNLLNKPNIVAALR